MSASQSDRALHRLHDVELAALAAAGGRREFGELVRRHGSAVRALLRRMGADAASADDLAQDAFMQAFEAIAEFRGEGTFAGWVKRIAARLYLKRRQKEARFVLDGQDHEPDQPIGFADAAGRIDLDGALKLLSPAERLCVSLCYGAGLSHAEVAETLNTPLGTVKSHVRRGLDKLRERLAPDGGQAGSRAHG
ncbi:sigma-70 family RNA polymerase sigma factor [Caulobacter sp. 17J65-9]|uniref:RNA polymerase sigma factor n=1 Tax=Caulobacter sp. 17J65-9 TaxID=2709382 RepID=UPI0013CBFE51|nr:sigma-70 family RNA polymerase sigma factor [Caulobacter sp. 17J65-9]NEX91281.1 sigma-70 family RNA polymerase sigma factor [Caulobacter sp. 17J65-9]